MQENPYKILAVSRLASDAEIVKAFASAMKARKYPPDAIAKARKSLMDRDERVLADYLSPNIPPIARFRTSTTEEAEPSQDLNQAQLDPTQIDELIKVEVANLAKENRDRAIDLELANLIWES